MRSNEPMQDRKIMEDRDQIMIRTDIRPGDIDRLISLHGRLYEEEYGYDSDFESYVAQTFEGFPDPGGERKDRIWIVERKDEIMGSVAVVGHSEDQAQLRWLLIHPDIRGRGIGKKIMKMALDHARSCGFRTIFLTTQDILKDAARLYQLFGFHITHEEDSEKWGLRMTAQRYDLVL